jgi:HEAT repeat protein
VAAAGLAGAPPSYRVVRALLNAVQADRPVPAGLLVDSLLRLGPGATEHLAAALATGSPHVRAVAAETLGLLGTTEAAAALLAALADPAATAEVRARAAGALGRIGTPAAIDPLIGCLDPDEPPGLRTAAAKALGELSSPRAVPHLVGLLAGPYPLAATAAAALARLGPPAAAALAEVVAAEPVTPAGRHAEAGLAAMRLVTGAVPPVPVG